VILPPLVFPGPMVTYRQGCEGLRPHAGPLEAAEDPAIVAVEVNCPALRDQEMSATLMLNLKNLVMVHSRERILRVCGLAEAVELVVCNPSMNEL
jgi:hypothetical protein